MNWNSNQAGEGFEYHLLVVGKAFALIITLPEGRYAWLQIINGELALRGRRMGRGWSRSMQERLMSFSTPDQTRFMIFDLN